MRSIRVPAEIILTFPAEVKVDQTIIETACFACEQHMNSIGMINYKGAMLQTGTLSFGLRVHLHDPAVLKGEVVHQFPSPVERLINFPDLPEILEDKKTS